MKEFKENQEISKNSNWFWRAGWLGLRAGWLGPGIWQAKSSKMMEILPKIFKKAFLIFIFFKISRKSTRFLLGPAPAGSGQLRPARPSSFCSKNPRPSKDLTFLRHPRPAENRLKNDFPILSNRCHIWRVSNSLISNI